MKKAVTWRICLLLLQQRSLDVSLPQIPAQVCKEDGFYISCAW